VDSNIDRICAGVSACKSFAGAGEALIKIMIDKTEIIDGVMFEVRFVSICPVMSTEITIRDTCEFEETSVTNGRDAFLGEGVPVCVNNLNIHAAEKGFPYMRVPAMIKREIASPGTAETGYF
jgi:hypothetical protein